MGIVLILLGVAAIAFGYARARGPWARYQALKAQDENIARYESWRGGLRDTGTTATCSSGKSDTRRASAGLEIITSVPVSASAKSALVIPTSDAAETVRISVTSRMPVRTPGSARIPQSWASTAVWMLATTSALACKRVSPQTRY